MSIDFKKPDLQELKPRISVIGVGGAGGNAVNNMITAGLKGCDFVVANTDAQALMGSQAENRLQLGLRITQGLGAGSRPEIGRAAAEETLEQIETSLDGAHMCFIAAGMGGGTGTGAAPIVAKAARERGILTVAVVTKPFDFEGPKRMRQAEEGIAELHKHVDTLIIIPNQNLFRVADRSTTLQQAFGLADHVLHSGVRSITDLMVMPGLINLDFADVRTVMSEMGKAMMGTGEAEGENRALEAAERAINNPLLDEVSLRGAKGMIINVTGGYDLSLFEVDEAVTHIRGLIEGEPNIIFGAAFDENLEGRVRVSVVATGIEAAAVAVEVPTQKINRGFATVAGNFHKTEQSRAPTELPLPVAPAVMAAAILPQEEPLNLTDPIEEPVLANLGISTHDRGIAAESVVLFPRQSAPTPISDQLKQTSAAMDDLAVLQEAARPASLFQRVTNGFRAPAHRAPPSEPLPLEPRGGQRLLPEAGQDPFEIPTFLRRQSN